MKCFKATIAKTVKGVRDKLELSQRGLADLFNAESPRELKTSQADIAKYEKGATVCPADKYLKFISLVE